MENTIEILPTFRIPTRLWESISRLKKTDRQELCAAIVEYGCKGTINVDELKSTVAQALFIAWRHDLDNLRNADIEYANRAKTNSDNRKGKTKGNLNGAATTDQGNDNAAALADPTDPNDLATTAQENPNDLATTSKGNNNETKTTYKGNNNENAPIKNIKYKKEKKGEKKEIFTPPTLDEIRDLVKQENLSVNPEKFFYHYESRKWEGVDDWQARLRLWAVENAENAEKSTTNTTNGGKLLTYAEVCALVQSGKATFDDYINIPKPDGKGFMYQHKIP